MQNDNRSQITVLVLTSDPLFQNKHITSQNGHRYLRVIMVLRFP